jgi:uncharacterized protein (DUF58 family)
VPALLPANLLGRLEQLQLVAVRRSKSAAKGERSSRARGQSVEFADHRNYSAGDDFRRIDWNLFARLDRLYLRLYEEERELPVHIFLDQSESMKFGQPTKFRRAVQLAAACAYVGLSGFDRVSIVPFPGTDRTGLKHIRGKKSARALFASLEKLVPGGPAEFSALVRRKALEVRTPGVAFVLSDFLDPAGYEQGFRSLQGRGFKIHAIQILASEEISPSLSGDLKVIDSETSTEQEVTFGRHRLKKYQQTVKLYCKQLSDFCQKSGISYIFVRSEASLETTLLKEFRKHGVWS